ncbi:MAG: 50S ribosomal protein L32 [Candidatus Berkelbacteria bacterium]
MAEPKKRLTSTRSGNRRSHLEAKAKSLAVCKECKSPVLSHHICGKCGFYNGQDVLEIEKKAQEKEARRKEREKENE